MKINVTKLCNISSEHHFLTFIYRINAEIYDNYRREIAKSSGCTQNKKIVASLLNTIISMGKGPELESFIVSNYPECISGFVNSIFPDYDPKILTIPHRVIIEPSKLLKYADKPVYKHLTIDGVTYIEYLNAHEAELKNIKWILDNYSNTIVKINL